MKNNIILYLLLLFSFPLQAQNNWTKTETLIINGTIDLYQDQWEVKDQIYSDNKEVIVLETIELIDKELIISYTIKTPEDGQFFRPSLQIKLNNKIFNIEPENLFGSVNNQVSFKDEPQNHQIIWANLTEEYIQLNGSIEIQLIIDVHGNRPLPFNVDCGIQPTFTSRQKAPFYIAGLVGVGSLLAGRQFDNRSQEEYVLYTNGESENETLFQSANNKRHIGIVLNYSGVAILAVDAIWFLIRQRRYKKQLNTYNEFCNPEAVTLRPYINLDYSTHFQSGIQLSYNF